MSSRHRRTDERGWSPSAGQRANAPILDRIRRITLVVGCGLFIGATEEALALPSSTTAPAQESGLFDAVDGKLEQWIRREPDWAGPSKPATKRFLGLIDSLVERFPESTHTWKPILRGSSLGMDEGRPTQSPSLAEIGDACRDHFRAQLRGPHGGEFRSWLLSSVLVAQGQNSSRPSGAGEPFPSLDDRRTALKLCESARLEELRMPLLLVVRRKDDPLRPYALRTLARWARSFGADEAIDLYLVQLLGTKFDKSADPHPYSIILERIRASRDPLTDRARARLKVRVRHLLLANDWRDATRALSLAQGFPIEERVPMLLDALGAWQVRASSKRSVPGLTRVRAEIVRELQSISGLKHGPEPKPWLDWWVAIRNGELPMPGTPEFAMAVEEKNKIPMSTASFFGLRPETNRVTFIIDFSGSMEAGFGTTENTRYVEAVDQMMRFLQGAPDDAQFSVILFSTSPKVLNPGLVAATDDSLADIRRSLLSRAPAGGTNLRPAVERALFLGRDGYPDLDKAEADTIVVLCDGATAEGPKWVGPMLDRVLPLYPVKFHAVHIGPTEDGALRKLAERSGGEFIRVGG